MIREAKMSDAKRLLEIYAYYVRETAVSFEIEVPNLHEFENRMKRTMEKYPYLVLEDKAEIQGYAYAGAFVGRAAYAHSCELTVYLDKDSRGRGNGKALYIELEQKLKSMGIRNLYACIGDPIEEDEYLTKGSEKFHEHMRFTKVGEFHRCGYKFDRYYNMIWMEKLISSDG